MLQTDQLPVPGRELAKGRVDILSADSGIGITLFKVTGAMSFTDRQATVEQFVRQGGLLIGTDAALSEGIELGQVTDAIYYDLPANPMALEQRLGRFDPERAGQTAGAAQPGSRFF